MKIISKCYQAVKSPLRYAYNKFRGTNPIKLKSDPVEDTIKLSPQAMETKLMQEVRNYGMENGLETARIMDKEGDIIHLKMAETPLSISFPEQGFISLFLRLDNSNFIHYHPRNLPLSFNDISTMYNLQISKMTAVTPNGGVSSLIFPREKMIRMEGDKLQVPKGMNDIYFDIERISGEEVELWKKFKIFSEDEKVFAQNLNDTPEETIQKLAQ